MLSCAVVLSAHGCTVCIKKHPHILRTLSVVRAVTTGASPLVGNRPCPCARGKDGGRGVGDYGRGYDGGRGGGDFRGGGGGKGGACPSAPTSERRPYIAFCSGTLCVWILLRLLGSKSAHLDLEPLVVRTRKAMAGDTIAGDTIRGMTDVVEAATGMPCPLAHLCLSRLNFWLLLWSQACRRMADALCVCSDRYDERRDRSDEGSLLLA